MNTGKIRGNQQSIHVSYRELWHSVASNTSGSTGSTPDALIFVPGASGLAQLDALGSLYESYRMTGPIHVEFKSSAGSVNNGSIIAGVDYDARDINLGYASAAAKMPKFVGSITKDHRLTVEPARAMNKKWLFSESGGSAGEPAFALIYSNTATLTGGVGDIWCEYSLEFISPRINNAALVTRTVNIHPNATTYIQNGFSSGVRWGMGVSPAAASSASNISSDIIVGSGGFVPQGIYRFVAAYADTAGIFGTPTITGVDALLRQVGTALSTVGEIATYFQVLSPIVAGTRLFTVSKTKLTLDASAVSFAFAKTFLPPNP
jgi:hypothetical protein